MIDWNNGILKHGRFGLDITLKAIVIIGTLNSFFSLSKISMDLSMPNPLSDEMLVLLALS